VPSSAPYCCHHPLLAVRYPPLPRRLAL
jgi:hypothetical protein